MQRYSTNAFAALAAQLCRGPERLRLRQLHNIDFLLSVVESGRSYPYDFVCHGLTGYRPRPDSNGSSSEPRLLEGDALRADLVALAEELSGTAEIPLDAVPERLHTVHALAERFDVSTKTIFRWHRRGLVGWRIRASDRRARLMFPEHSVRRFVAENSELVARGASFSQLSTDERDALLVAARELLDSGKFSTVNSVARELSSRTGRAVETIRLLFKQHDAARPGQGLFNRARVEIASDSQSVQIWEAYREGAAIASLAKRFDRPIADVYGVVARMRARDLLSRPVEYIASDEYSLPGAREAILANPLLSVEGERTPEKRIPRDLPPYMQQLFRTPLLSREGERALFCKLNYLKFEAANALKRIDPDSASAVELDAIEQLLDEAADTKKRLVQANLRLVVSIAKRHLRPTQDFFELISDGNVSLMRAVDKFDFTRGFKFSTYASWAIMKNFARTIPEQQHHRERYQTGHDELLENRCELAPGAADNDYYPAVRGAIERMLGALDERESEILRQRFGLAGGEGAQTLEQVGRNFGVSKERVRQLESRAIAKLRSSFESDVLGLLGS